MIKNKDYILNRLAKFFYLYENHHLDVCGGDLLRHFSYLLDNEKLIIEFDDFGNIVGILEFFRLNYAKFGWLICNGSHFDVFKYDINEGPIAYLANILIKSSERKSSVIKRLKRRFFAINSDAKYIAGYKYGKRYKPIAIFKRGG
jgi:hypothetical protein